MDGDTYAELREVYHGWGWQLLADLWTAGRERLFVLRAYDTPESEKSPRARVHAYHSDSARFRVTMRFDPEIHSDVSWVIIYLVDAKKAYRFSRAEFQTLLMDAKSRWFGIKEDHRGFHMNIYADTDELHPVGQDGVQNPDLARIGIREFLEPRRPTSP